MITVPLSLGSDSALAVARYNFVPEGLRERGPGQQPAVAIAVAPNASMTVDVGTKVSVRISISVNARSCRDYPFLPWGPSRPCRLCDQPRATPMGSTQGAPDLSTASSGLL